MARALRRWTSRSCVAVAGASLLLAVGAPGSQAQDEPDDAALRPEVFRGEASSLVASVQVDRDALLPVPEVFRFIALDGSGTYGSSNQQARSSIFFPGNGLILGPSLVCGTFGSQFPPELGPVLDTCLQYEYPLTVFADSFEPDGATAGSLALGAPSDPLSANAVGASAHAGEDATTTDAVMQDLRVLGLPALGPVALPVPGLELDTSLLTIDSATSRTDQRIVDGDLVVRAESTVSGVRLVGGLVRIGAIRSVSQVRDDGAGTQTSDASFEVSGVTVAGVPAQITDEGLVLGSPSGGLGPLVQQIQAGVNGLLEALGVRITVLPVEETTEPPSAVASAAGILVEVATDVQGLPTVPGPLGDIDLNGVYSGSIRLGSTAARGTAASFDDDFEPEAPPVVDSGSVDPFVPPLPDGGLGLPSPEVAAPAAPDASGSGDRAPQLVREVVDLFGGRVGLLYLSFTLAALALCISPGLVTPARLPRYRP